MPLKYTILLLTLAVMVLTSSKCINTSKKHTKDPLLEQIKLPQGFQISVFARDVTNARSMTRGDKGTIFVGNRKEDKVYALVDKNNDGVADERYIIAEKMNTPNGVAFHKGALYIAEIDKIWRMDNIESNLASPPQRVLVTDSLPDDEHHGWKYIAFGPDDKLYVPVGAPCNICDDNERDKRFSSITRMNADGSGFEVFAHGIRNTVGFDWHPETKELWFTENGRDWMGAKIPPDELNHAPRADMHFGYPYCHGGTIADPDFGKKRNCNEFTPPIANLGAHVAALGMKFYTGNMFPEEYRNQVFIAEHGSWNSPDLVGYRVSMVRFKEDGSAVYATFADGWVHEGKAWGRPVDILQLPDGSLLVSDDFGGVIYRITYEK